MGRPAGRRKICLKLKSDYFKPQGVPVRNLEVVELSREELEALRLKNILELDQVEAAKRMNTSQSTYQRILAKANKKVSQALVDGQAIKIIK
jgi:predicted DNA-binding protein (UPF0251 family)